MRRASYLLPAMCLVTLASTGCVPQDRYDQLLTTNRSLQEQMVATEEERDQSQAQVRMLQNQVNQMRASVDQLQSEKDGLFGSIDRMEKDSEEWMRRVASLEFGPLPQEIASAIADLAMAHPDLLTFDAQHGLLRFASDFTFDLGSAELSSDAQQTIQALAMILNEPAARNLEAQIIGHTDNVPIGKPETRRNHPTNVHLSVHRSISVRDALAQSGIDPARLLVGGYGEFRPIAANERSGSPDNRRVEIYLTAMQGTYASSAPTTREPNGERATGEITEPMK